MSRHTCMEDGCSNDTGAADRLRCRQCEPREVLTPAERRWRQNDRRRERKEAERGTFNAREFWQNVKEARADTGERGP